MRSSSAITMLASSTSWLLDRLERAVERGDHQVEPAERLLLEARELLLEVGSGGLRHDCA